MVTVSQKRPSERAGQHRPHLLLAKVGLAVPLVLLHDTHEIAVVELAPPLLRLAEVSMFRVKNRRDVRNPSQMDTKHRVLSYTSK